MDPGPGRARRLETHAWHAKRMRMSAEAAEATAPDHNDDDDDDSTNNAANPTWGFRLALSATRRPSKACVRAARRQCVLHDASYTRVLELSGPAGAVAALLAACLDPVDATVAMEPIVERMAEAVLHRPGAFPQGALGPVRWLWRPCLPPLPAKADGAASASALWLWLHPAFADAAKGAIEAHIAASSSPVELNPVPDLLLFEARGPGAHPLLRRALRPCSSSASEGAVGEGQGNALWAGLLRHVSSSRPELFPAHGTVVALRVEDPREAAEGEKEEDGGGIRKGPKTNKTRRGKLQALLSAWPSKGSSSSLWSAETRVAAAAAAAARTDAVVNARRHRGRRAGTWQGVMARAEGAEEERVETRESGDLFGGVPVLVVARGGKGSRGLFLDGGVRERAVCMRARVCLSICRL